jgi:arylsulfatase A-like enzyme
MRLGLRAVSVLSIIACYAFYFFEWLFFITKPSMFSAMSVWDSFLVLLVSPIPLITGCLLLIFIIGLIARLPWRFFSPVFLGLVALLIPAFIMAATAFLLINNFTYTLFNFNVGSFDGPVRYLYALIFLVLGGSLFRYLNTTLQRSFWLDRQNAVVYSVCVPLSISVLVAIFQFEKAQPGVPEGQDDSIAKSPNILVLSSDGVVAQRMSAYGYHRDTTPFISSVLENALIFENSFTNSEKTTGSVASLLSGRLPTTTRVLIRPDSFQGKNSFLHLPGVLKNLGYRTADISIRYYADAYDLNMKKAFDYANGRRISERIAYSFLPLDMQLSYASELRFLGETSERVRMRILHAMGLDEMINPYEEVKQLNGSPKELYGNDIDRIESLLKFTDESDRPFFAHIHLLGTHGPKFFPRERKFSLNQTQQLSKDPYKDELPMVDQHQLRVLDWMGDFYDDAMLDFDRYVREIFQHLKEKGKLEDTLIVLTSDHGVVRSSHERLPLIMWFPKNRYTGSRTQNAQRLDIAPTILDFIGLPIPEWMEGDSLLEETVSPLRFIISVGMNIKNVGLIDGWWGNARSEAPFYSLGSLSIIHCQNWYFISLENGLMTSQEVENHSSPCNDGELLTVPQARKLMVDHLTQKGYEAESLLDGEYEPSPNFLQVIVMTLQLQCHVMTRCGVQKLNRACASITPVISKKRCNYSKVHQTIILKMKWLITIFAQR